jgi:hypothetical protein
MENDEDTTRRCGGTGSDVGFDINQVAGHSERSNVVIKGGNNGKGGTVAEPCRTGTTVAPPPAVMEVCNVLLVEYDTSADAVTCNHVAATATAPPVILEVAATV